jgi:hypothetical protein
VRKIQRISLLLSFLTFGHAHAQTSVVLKASHRPAAIDVSSYQLPVILPDPEAVDAGLSWLGGMAGWAAGLGAGAVAGFMLVDRQNQNDDGFPAGSIVGAYAGVAVGAPLGVHLVNRRRGIYLASVLATSLLSYGGYHMMIRTDHPDKALAIIAGTAFTQIAVSITIEELTMGLK